jgi:hypothetical protein
MAKAKNEQTKRGREEYLNGQPCKHEECSNEFRTLPCPYCGRTKMRGNSIIEVRRGFVYLERLKDIDIKLHNQLPAEEQKNATLTIFKAPKHTE